MDSGTIKSTRYLADRGYAFITRDDGSDLFFHVKDLDKDTREDELVEGAPVSFKIARSDRGPKAVGVRVLHGEPGSAESPDITEDEAVAGLKQALLATLEWADVLERLRKERS